MAPLLLEVRTFICAGMCSLFAHSRIVLVVTQHDVIMVDSVGEKCTFSRPLSSITKVSWDKRTDALFRIVFDGSDVVRSTPTLWEGDLHQLTDCAVGDSLV